MGLEQEEFDLPLPFGGVSDDLAFSQQKLHTTREAFNVRGQDKKGRQRISRRAGLSLANTAQVDASRVVELISTVYDARNLLYSFTGGSESQEWAKDSPSSSAVFGCATDQQGNLYITDGAASVAKLNSDGLVIWQFPLPDVDKGHSIRFVYVDDLFDVYVGVSDGTRQDLGRLWRLRQLPEAEVEVAWQVDLNSYVEAAKVYKDKLYTLQNEPDSGRAYVRVYSALEAPLPILSKEWEVPFPAHDFDINEAGEVAVATTRQDNSASANINRFDPQWPRTSASGRALNPQVADWTPYDLDQYSKRIWSWFMGEDITEFDVQGQFIDGAPVLRWRDRSGKNRHLYEPSSIGLSPPTLALKALGKRTGVRFNGVDQALVSLSNSSTATQYADQQKTLWPAYEDSMFVTIVVVRPEKKASGTAMAIIKQDNDSGGGAQDHILAANRTSSGGSLPGTFSSGGICHIAATDTTGDGGAGSGGHPLAGSFDDDHDAAIVVILWDGAVDPNDTSKTRSLFQVNGKPIDRYEGLGNITKAATVVGAAPGTGLDPMSGDILAIFTLDRRDRQDNTTEPKVLTHDQLETGDPSADQTDNELTRLVGYFAHYFGLSHLLPKDSTSLYDHPYGQTSQTFFTTAFSDVLTGPPTGGPFGAWGKAIRNHPCLTKWSASGDLIWTINGEDADPLDGNSGLVGVGYGVRFDLDGNLFSIGPTTTAYDSSPSTLTLRKIIDEGDDYSLASADGAWGVAIGDPGWAWPRMAVDKFGNLYVPLSGTSSHLRVYKGSDGTLLSSVVVGIPERNLFAVALDPNIPDYGDDLTDQMARFVYAVGQAGADPSLPVYKIRLIQESPLSGSPRAMVNLVISATGTIRTWDVGGVSMGTPTGASGALSATANYIQATSGFERIFITDGVSKIQVYDPREDAIAALESETSGEPPHGAKILEFWSGRLVGARAPGLINGAFNWAMSRKGDCFDWDNFPVERDSAAAIAGSNAVGPGYVPDIVNSFVPYNDDLAFFGCDHSIYQLTGDPGDGGVFDLVSDITGMAFGRAWCKDPEGRLWFVGSRGGLWVMAPGGRPQRVSDKNIDARLNAIDFSAHYVRLAWNDRDKGVMIHRYPFGTPGAPVEHWFWDSKRGAPWPDTFGSAADPDMEPTAMYVIDGDSPDDRLLLLGGRDGRIRKWDPDALDDDGTPIYSTVVIGPLAGGSTRREMRFVGPRVVLAADMDGATFDLYATDDPTLLGAPRASGVLFAGRNPLKRARVVGSYCFVRIGNAVAGQTFAIEEAGIRAYPAGIKRPRTPR